MVREPPIPRTAEQFQNILIKGLRGGFQAFHRVEVGKDRPADRFRRHPDVALLLNPNRDPISDLFPSLGSASIFPVHRAHSLGRGKLEFT